MLKIYGSKLCPDCVECLEAFDRHGVSYEYFDFSENLQNLKEFLSLRDRESLFDPIKTAGSIGIPCIIDEAGKITLDWSIYVSQDNA